MSAPFHRASTWREFTDFTVNFTVSKACRDRTIPKNAETGLINPNTGAINRPLIETGFFDSRRV